MTAAAVTGHAAAAGTEVLHVCRWNRTQSFLDARGRVRPKPPSDALRAIGGALQRVASVLQ